MKPSDDGALFDLYCNAVDGGMEIDFAMSCIKEVLRRMDSGRSHDCDEYRALVVNSRNAN